MHESHLIHLFDYETVELRVLPNWTDRIDLSDRYTWTRFRLELVLLFCITKPNRDFAIIAPNLHAIVVEACHVLNARDSLGNLSASPDLVFSESIEMQAQILEFQYELCSTIMHALDQFGGDSTHPTLSSTVAQECLVIDAWRCS